MARSRATPIHLKYDCHTKNLGLTDDELASFSGFSSRAFKALAHLREAWLSADLNNKAAVASCIRELLKGHSMNEEHNRKMAMTILRYNHGRGDELIRQLYPKLLQSVGSTSETPGP